MQRSGRRDEKAIVIWIRTYAEVGVFAVCVPRFRELCQQYLFGVDEETNQHIRVHSHGLSESSGMTSPKKLLNSVSICTGIRSFGQSTEDLPIETPRTGDLT